MEYNCDICNYKTKYVYNYNKHIKTLKHKNKEEEIHLLEDENTNNFICNICNKKLCSKQSLINHNITCRGVSSSLECYKCNKKFNNRSTRYKHEKKCNITNSKLININNTTNITNNITNNNIINNTINITVNNLGNEKIEYLIDDPEFIKFMNNCIENKIDGICNLIAKKHFDPLHPENHNIRKLNKKDNFIEIFNNNSWNLKNYKDGLDHFTITLETTISHFMEKMVENNIEIKYDVIQHFMKEIGTILHWDLSTDSYDFSYQNRDMKNYKLSEKDEKMLLTKIYRLFCECLFKYSKIIHKRST
jgi:hypothetical protein